MKLLLVSFNYTRGPIESSVLIEYIIEIMSPFQTSLCAVMFVNCMLEAWLFYGFTSEDSISPILYSQIKKRHLNPSL